ncbi:hypothetical protein [Nostoc sp. FACHB-133]|uniref:hypothetical protein n=1 Tax=Nostoc sp. FACHB-133 TaxID=2692835 RepID=UPI0016885609|nr:hypothetical protein [Nostoc sp. FACHB-133]MBD2526815.1 hypothetical protein [Nostoc sp. FACHB-133]
MITKVIDALLIIESLLSEKVRVSAFKNASITHVISLNPVFCANATHTPVNSIELLARTIGTSQAAIAQVYSSLDLLLCFYSRV